MSMLIVVFDIKGIVYKEFVLAGQTVCSAYYCDVLRQLRENVRRLPSELWQRQKNWLLHHDNAPSQTSFFARKFFTKNNMTVVPHPPYFSVSPFEDLKGLHFATIEMIEAESQAVLNALTEHDFQMHLKKWRSIWNGAHAQKGTGTTSRVMAASRPKVSC
jgi:hypothetical protein